MKGVMARINLKEPTGIIYKITNKINNKINITKIWYNCFKEVHSVKRIQEIYFKRKRC